MRLIDADKHEKATELMEALDALTAKPTPDPETGLMPCGCGQLATIKMLTSYPPLYEIECSCGVRTKVYKSSEDAKSAWNRAMGGEG